MSMPAVGKNGMSAAGAAHREAAALLGGEQVAGLDLLQHAGDHVAHRRLAAARNGGDADQAISKPAAAGRVPSMGSTMRMSSGSAAPCSPPSSE